MKVMDIEEFINRKLTKTGEMPNGDNIYWITEKSVNKIKDQLRIGGVIKSFNSEEELLQFIYMNTPICIKPKSKRAKGQLVLTFTSRNAFEQVCKELAKKLFNEC
ncbi:hypothetical protein [Mesoflavibacter sp. CH_XMU1404-2]|uniref:hypothetical protein n=1 Tax=Mesoflavibacter sp. CH_XMU1404-2 TaxID=3107766 RepID=UPI003009725B